ncbi:PLP-dependent aminotransferase family protein [Vibrio europaeus]|uniref:PLP-dependent aminotransferase family protein n=1 Tax=Vibrio europaeus TaxID=300876 RepID=A0AAE7B0Z8_9VIBR|nr:PLP-dependent aminotransferase family protein [Vibrio europaeus]MDC5805967.1 PLP-dependent aminotransferase family protein [Vibrio europaeus]MDC5812265.1 PLP-dependent aminotransferase family protein [Vibrio europaeus]MDC5825961.1 PLP-dependent aminotransferase family protein [Vibrio europaeus]MDC5831324.1 PLP-dependent aminotransferase family protein [Vibrio europaeus]MDC5834280.1 PLP-dependent aminotransferase family protein [Vibrio europaeus]
MALIDIGDLQLSKESRTKQDALFNAVRDKIVGQLWGKGLKLPSTRKLAEELNLSRNTVIHAYEQLHAEGYLESRVGSGYFVALELPDQFVTTAYQSIEPSRPVKAADYSRAFSPGVPDLGEFPTQKWQRLLSRHISRVNLLGGQDVQGDGNLREALASYLATSRSVVCDPDRVVITSGAQQALTIAALLTVKEGHSMLMEQPGYAQMAKVLNLLNCDWSPAVVVPKSGLDLNLVESSSSKVIYVTPSNQYPLGTTLDINQRLRLIEWAKNRNGWIIEDDYDSEFQFAHRPYPSLQGLAAKTGHDQHVIYVGSLSKVMFNSLRLGYLVLPKPMVEQALSIKDALSGDSPSHTQAALADFIAEGDLVRHIRKMRRLYKQKHQMMLTMIERYFQRDLEVISQAAGLHVTVKWRGHISEHDWAVRASACGIVIRPFSYYEQHDGGVQRDWSGAVLGFGNVVLDEIEPNIRTLAEMFKS